MRKTYIAPSVETTGQVVRATLSGPFTGNEIAQPTVKHPA